MNRVGTMVVGVAGWLALLSGAIAAPSPPLRPTMQCPSTLPELTPLLLRDLPSYANRVSQRAFNRPNSYNLPGYVLLARRPQEQPLTLGPGIYRSTSDIGQSEPEQLFFTTLDRQYVRGQSVELQHYHWAFLTPTRYGWRLVLLFSALGTFPATEPPTPPQNTSQGVVGQAIALWLRDCQAGAIYPATGEG